MRRRNKKYDLYFVIIILLLIAGHLIYSRLYSEERGIKAYQSALELYKAADYESAYKEFAKVPSASCLKDSALFRQARCATNTGKNEVAIKKYNKIAHSNSKSSIVPISEYNMAVLLFEMKDHEAKQHFLHIIKKHPTSDYAIASEYYLGMIDLNIANNKKNPKKKEKIEEQALIHFKNYIEKSPDGRFSLNSAKKITEFSKKLNNYDNLLLAKTYYANGEYTKAKEFLDKTTLKESWTDFAKNEFKLGNKDKTRYYTEKGLAEFADGTNTSDIYEAIDFYILTYPQRGDGIKALVSKDYKSSGADYISYLNCNEIVPQNEKGACYKSLYEKHPDGQFSADALYNLFLTKYLQKKYLDAQRLGFLHLNKFPNVNSSPAVTYFMGRIAYKLKHYESANNYYKKTINLYPDSYYAFRANYNLYKSEGALPFENINTKPVVFPYKKSMENNLVIKLALLKDYDLVEELCKKDKFIQSWVAYQKGNYTISAVLARKAMEELSTKPPFDDLRWRLIYPLHYYEIVTKFKGNNNPIVVQAIMKEESHFNPYARSFTNASGLMQLMPATYTEVASRYGLSGSIDSPENNILAGSLYYEGLKKVLGNKDIYAISAYNGGIGSVTNWFSKYTYSDTDEFIEQIPYTETKNYVKKVLRTYWVYGNIYQ